MISIKKSMQGTPDKLQAEAQAFALKPIFGVESNSVTPTLPVRKNCSLQPHNFS